MPTTLPVIDIAALIHDAASAGLDADYFAEHGTRDPLVLFRIFQYPSRPALREARWGVGEHTDYGLLTMLRQDDVGDMLDRMTGGAYRSTPHRVSLNASGRDRISMPFFFDPAFDARVSPIPGYADAAPDDRTQRWDQASVHAFDGRYGDYLLGKIGKVFPDLGRSVL
jgi:polar amino acid transport system ATP-binding protein